MLYNLEEYMLIGEGTNSKCYFHPFDKTKCIKISKSAKEAKKRMVREIKSHLILRKRGIPSSIVSSYLGKIITNLGQGYVFDYISDKNGNVCKSLQDSIDVFSKEKLIDSLQGLYNKCYDNAVIVSDLHPTNIVITECGELCIIDGIGCGESINLCNWSVYFTHKKLNRKFKKLCLRLGINIKMK